jgi:hypothetical protein
MNSASVRRSSAPTANVLVADGPVRVLAVIDSPDPSNSEHNERVVRLAAQLAERTGAELHVASTYSPYPEDVRSYRVERYLPALRVKARDRRRCSIRQLLRRMKTTHAFIHVVERKSQQGIGALASSLNAVVVDGAATRAAGAAISVEGIRVPQDFAA